MENLDKKIKTLIVDDEPLARQNLRMLLEADPEIKIIGECRNAQEALKVIKAQSIDLLFLDVQMPELSGFDLLKKIDYSKIPAIVFVTAYDQYALSAFEVHAIDYLLKPFTDERFEKALKQAKTQIRQVEVNQLSKKLFSLLGSHETKLDDRPSPEKFITRVMIKSAGRMVFLKVEEIDWISADDYYVKLHRGRKSYQLRESLNKLEGELDPMMFLRIHRSTIVNINRIKEIQTHFNGNFIVLLSDGTELLLSRSRREHAQMILKGVIRT
jgi:two-component system LytT family response regulator